MEGEAQNLDHESQIGSPVKRKSDVIRSEEGDDERMMKQQKLEENGNAGKEKEKLNLSAKDKGKGKMVAEEEIGDCGDDEDRSSEKNDDDDEDDDSDLSDDNYAEMDLDNILPVRTRRRAVVEPGAYLVEVNDDDDDDDDDDVVDDHDDDDEEEEEEEEESK